MTDTQADRPAGPWGRSGDDEFDDLVGTLASVTKAPRDAVIAEVKAQVAEHGGLLRQHALRIAEQSGFSSRQLWRYAAACKPAAEEDPELTGLFTDRLAEHGPEAFVFDELALSLLYLCAGSRARFRREVMAAGYPMPSEPTLSRRWNELPLQVRDGVREGHVQQVQEPAVRAQGAGRDSE